MGGATLLLPPLLVVQEEETLAPIEILQYFLDVAGGAKL